MSRLIAVKLRRLTSFKLPLSAARFSSQVFVSRLSFYTTNEELQNMFSPFGDVQEARLIMDPRTGRTKGFGFVTFGTEAEAQKAVKSMDGRIIKGRLIFAEIAKDKDTEGESADYQS